MALNPRKKLTTEQRNEAHEAAYNFLEQLNENFKGRWKDPELDLYISRWLDGRKDITRRLIGEFIVELREASKRRSRAILHDLKQGSLNLDGGYDHFRRSLITLPDGDNVMFGYAKHEELSRLAKRSKNNREAVDKADNLLQAELAPILEAQKADPNLTVDDVVGWIEPEPESPPDAHPPL